MTAARMARMCAPQHVSDPSEVPVAVYGTAVKIFPYW